MSELPNVEDQPVMKKSMTGLPQKRVDIIQKDSIVTSEEKVSIDKPSITTSGIAR
jgi:hypothetical protein